MDAEPVGNELLVGGDQPGAVFDIAHHELDAIVLELDRRSLGKAAAATLGIGRHADAAQLAAFLAFAAARLETRPVGLVHAQVHHALELDGNERVLGCLRLYYLGMSGRIDPEE